MARASCPFGKRGNVEPTLHRVARVVTLRLDPAVLDPIGGGRTGPTVNAWFACVARCRYRHAVQTGIFEAIYNLESLRLVFASCSVARGRRVPCRVACRCRLHTELLSTPCALPTRSPSMTAILGALARYDRERHNGPSIAGVNAAFASDDIRHAAANATGRRARRYARTHCAQHGHPQAPLLRSASRHLRLK